MNEPLNEPAVLPPLVLVVEDDADAREMFEAVLDASGFRVASAGDGLAAIEHARTLHPRLIVMDLSLPSMNGWDAARSLKGDEATRDIPILALSGNPIDQRGDAQPVFAGALLKPCFPDDLVAEIRRLLEPLHS